MFLTTRVSSTGSRERLSLRLMLQSKKLLSAPESNSTARERGLDGKSKDTTGPEKEKWVRRWFGSPAGEPSLLVELGRQR